MGSLASRRHDLFKELVGGWNQAQVELLDFSAWCPFTEQQVK